MTAPGTPRHHRDWGFLAIAILKLVKGALLLMVGLGALLLLDQRVMNLVSHWVKLLQLETHSHLLQRLVAGLSGIPHKDIVLVSCTTFVYAALLLTEGVGLILEKVWAEYLTFLFTASFVPFEVYKLIQHPTKPRATVLVLNLLVIAYLAIRIDQGARAKRRARAATPSTPAERSG